MHTESTASSPHYKHFQLKYIGNRHGLASAIRIPRTGRPKTQPFTVPFAFSTYLSRVLWPTLTDRLTDWLTPLLHRIRTASFLSDPAGGDSDESTNWWPHLQCFFFFCIFFFIFCPFRFYTPLLVCDSDSTMWWPHRGWRTVGIRAAFTVDDGHDQDPGPGDMTDASRRLIDEETPTRSNSIDRTLLKPLARLVSKTHSLSSTKFQSVPTSEERAVEEPVVDDDDDDDDDGGCQIEVLREELRNKIEKPRRRSVTAPPSPIAPRPPPRTPSRRPHLPHLPHLIPWKEFRGRWGTENAHSRTNEVLIQRVVVDGECALLCLCACCKSDARHGKFCIFGHFFFCFSKGGS